MSTFVGSNAGETITPGLVSPTVKVIGNPKAPSNAADIIIAGGGNDIVAGGGGNDIALLGAGDDRFIWNPGDGSDIVDGGKGTDTLEFNGSGANETMTLSFKCGVTQLTRDVGNISMRLTSMERIEIDAGAGADKINVSDLSGSGVTQVAIDLSAGNGATTADGFADAVKLDGRSSAENISLTLDGQAVVVNGLAAQVRIANSEAQDDLIINGFAGNDVIDGSALLATHPKLTLDGGAGNDRLLGGANNDTLLGGDGNDFIDGNRGADTAFMGAGDDVFQWDPGDGSDVVEGQAGTDEMLFNGAGANENFDLSANGERARFFRDVGNITMDLNEVERVQLNALGGADNFTINDLTATDVRQVNVDLAGDTQQDSILANGAATDETVTISTVSGETVVTGLSAELRVKGADAGLDRLTISGQSGADVVDASALAANAVKLSLLGGAGNDRFIGSAGDDFIDGDQGADIAFMGAGDDVFQWDPGDGSDIVEGQDGFDTMLFNGSGANEVIDITASGERAIFHRDIGNITMDNNDVERLEFNALGGSDTINVADLSGTDATEVAIDLAAVAGVVGGDAQADRVNVAGTAGDDIAVLATDGGEIVVDGLAAQVRVGNAEADRDTLALQMGAGDDIVDASSLSASLASLTLDGGEGDDVLIAGELDSVLLGGAGDDVLIGGIGDDVLDGGDGDDILIGGAGDDIFLNGEIIIDDFVAGAGTEDRIDLRTLGAGHDFNWVLAHASEADGSTFLDFGDQQMTLLNTSLSSLHGDDFLV